MSPSKEILEDIENWSATKLKQWFLDSMARYEMMDMTEDAAMSHTLVILMATCATMLALCKVTPEEAGNKIAESIQLIRNKARNKKCKTPKA